MGVRGRGSLDLAVFGSTTYRVIQLGPCPVLAVHIWGAHRWPQTEWWPERPPADVLM